MAYTLPTDVLKSAVDLAANEGETLVGWRPITEPRPAVSRQMQAKAYLVVTDKGYYEFYPDGLCYRAAVLHSFNEVM